MQYIGEVQRRCCRAVRYQHTEVGHCAKAPRGTGAKQDPAEHPLDAEHVAKEGVP